MEIVDRGVGDPVIVVPGIQGRWEYCAQAIDALASRARVITFSLDAESATDIDAYANRLAAVMTACALERATICGISFGGLVALRFAATHPSRIAALVLASTPGPRWHLKPRHDIYVRWPRVFGAIFAIESPFRLRRELLAAFPTAQERRRFGRGQLACLWRAPLSLPRMAARARAIGRHDRLADCGRVECPTLVVHGDPALDHVVDANGTSEYAALIRGAVVRTMPDTGHLGSITKPDRFAGIVCDFMAARQSSSPAIRQSTISREAVRGSAA